MQILHLFAGSIQQYPEEPSDPDRYRTGSRFMGKSDGKRESSNSCGKGSAVTSNASPAVSAADGFSLVFLHWRKGQDLFCRLDRFFVAGEEPLPRFGRRL